MRRHSALLGFTFSVLAVWWLWGAIDPSVLTNVLIRRPAWGYLSPFLLLTILILFCFAARWRVLVGAKLAYPDAVVAALFCIGGNMILPARGGDLLRLHQTSIVSGIGMWRLAGSLMIEKLLDLALIIGVGLFSVAVIGCLC